MTHQRKALFLVALLSYSWKGESFSSPAHGAGRAFAMPRVTTSTCTAAPLSHRPSRNSRVALQDSLREGKSTDLYSTRRWHRRIFSKLLHRRNKATHLGMANGIMDAETEALMDSIDMYTNDDNENREFILQNFEIVNPEQVLAEVIQSTADIASLSNAQDANIMIDEEFFDVAITAPTTAPNVQRRTRRSKNLSLPRLVAGLIESVLTNRILKHSLELPEDLSVQVDPMASRLRRLLLRGQLQANVRLCTGRLVFAPIRFSKGKVELEKVTLNLLGFLQQDKRTPQDNQSSQKPANKNVVRYPKQFDLHLEDLTMSRHDLLFSPCIKNGLRRLLINILQDRGLQSSSIRITSIDILPSGKISCVGEARTHFGSSIPFEVRSGISFANRGHVLTFPGLEISLNRDIGLFVPVVPTIDLDVGHNAQFRRINIDGKKKQIELDASVTITPDRTIRLMKQYVQSSEAFSSRFAVDVGRWLTELGRFSK